MNQIVLHNKMDLILLKNPAEVSKQEVFSLIAINEDARQYFYSQANEIWFDWLWQNGFFDVIKAKAQDTSQYGYRIPELYYLVKIAEKVPVKVVDFMLSFSISSETFNPEVVDRFTWICGTLPAEQLARIVYKILKEEWIPLMGSFNQWGFDYEKILETLSKTKDYNSILTLAEALLSIRPKEEFEKDTNLSLLDNPFYVKDLSYAKVFEYLVEINDNYAEQAFELVTKLMGKIVLLGGNTTEDRLFPIEDKYLLSDTDLFTLKLGKEEKESYRYNIRQLVAVIKILANRLIEHCANADTIRSLYSKYIDKLPQSIAMWRLKLYFLSLRPEIFKPELKIAFFKLFEAKNYYEIISGAEYKKTLKIGFPVLEDNDKREYVKNVISYFSKKEKDKDSGGSILSMIYNFLTETEKKEVKKTGFRIIHGYEPNPSIGTGRSGWVNPRGPISQEDFSKLSIVEIIKNLKEDWKPEKLSSKNTFDDFLTPLNAEGVESLLKNDISVRLQEYIDNADLFFNPEELDCHYTYSFFRGIQETFRNNKTSTNAINWDKLISFIARILDSMNKKPFSLESGKRDSSGWLDGWENVYSVIADVVYCLINDKNDSLIRNFPVYRDKLLGIIKYFLAYPDPIPEDEKIDSAKLTVSSKSAESNVNDPFTTAINSVRGKGFESLVRFLYQDSKNYDKKEKIKISSDVKALYESVLEKENTRAIMFMFGHYLPSFYFRDIPWIHGLLPVIFPSDPSKKHLYTAAWEGYLVNDIYGEMFSDIEIQKLYERGIALKESDYTPRRHFRDPDDSIATHLVLAFMYFKEFNFDHSLFKAFWENNNSKRHANFVKFLGQIFISGNNENADNQLKNNKGSKQRLRDFWDWLLSKYTDSKIFIEFGNWINLEKDIFESIWLAEHIKKTLEKTKGCLSWDHYLLETIDKFAEKSPEDTLSIIRLFLLEGGVHGNNRGVTYHIDKEWFDVIKTLYNNPITKSGAYSLINDLISEGGSPFWCLKKILDN